MARRTGGKRQHGRFGGSNKVHRDERLLTVRSAQFTTGCGQTDVFIVLGLTLATLAVYGQVITHHFISLDDDLYIRDNPMVTGGLTLSGIGWAFTTFHAANWHPLTWLSHMMDSQVFGPNAGGHLFVSAIIHVLNTLLVFFFLKRVTGARWRSAIVAALFALHPLHVESVAWAAERKDTLSTFFGLLALLAYARYVELRSLGRYMVVVLCLSFGLMAKPMLVTWPFLLLLLDYWPLQRLRWQPGEGMKPFLKALLPLVREKVPLFCVVVASMIVTFLAQSHGGAVRGFVDAPLSLRLSNALVSYAKYLLLTFWPSGLGVYYPFSPEGVPAWQLAVALVLVAAITGVAFHQADNRAYLTAGWLWFLGTLIPVIGLVQVGGQSMADRYHYIPSIGLFLAIVFGLADLARAFRVGRVAIGVASVIGLLLFGSLAGLQVSRWRDSKTLFEYTLTATSDNLVVQYNLGHVLGQEKKYDEAVPHFEEALRIKPDFFDALVNMGVTRFEQGKLEEAVSFYQRALDVEPRSGKAHMQLGLALVRQKKDDDALQHFRTALKLAPNNPDVRTNLGLMLARQGELSEAASQLEEAVQLNPNSAEAHNNLGLVYLMARQPEKSLPHFSEALRLKPDLTVAQDNLQRAQKQLGGQQR